MSIAEKLAEISLKIGAIRLNPEKPFRWASGYYMPIYNDNRMLLSDYSYRDLVTEGFRDLIYKNKIEFDVVGGTNSAGIAPATSLADSVDKALAVVHNGASYLFTVLFRKILLDMIEHPYPEDYDTVASTCPFSIIPGIKFANERELPFIYVRKTKKTHGLEQQIEGILDKGDSVILIDFCEERDSYSDMAVRAIEERGGRVVDVLNNNFRFKPRNVAGARILHIEDLISTGGSSIKEIDVFRDSGAGVDYCFSIFNYDFDETKERFKENNIKINSILYYDVLLNIAKKVGYIKEAQLKMLEEWRENPFGWGEEHGFPREE